MFPNKFDVGIAYVLKVGIIIIIFKFYSLGVAFFLIFLPQFFDKFFVVYLFFLNLHYF